MLISIKQYSKKYDFELENITQILGYDFTDKNFVIDSIVKHFSTYKYKDNEEYMIDNILIDNEIPGRKEYNVIYIKNKESIINYIKFGKISLFAQYIKEKMGCFHCQNEIIEIDNILTNIYDSINNDIKGEISNISLEYEFEELINIVSKSNVATIDGEEIESLTIFKLLISLINIIFSLSNIKNEKYLLIVENVDQMCSAKEYKDILNIILGLKSKFYCIFTSCIDNFAYINPNIIEGVVVFNKNKFQMPIYDSVKDFIINHYPLNIEFSDDEICEIIGKIVNRIGIDGYKISYKEMLYLKMFNKSLCVNDEYEFDMKDAEKACLLS